jgi:hypothetical protein
MHGPFNSQERSTQFFAGFAYFNICGLTFRNRKMQRVYPISYGFCRSLIRLHHFRRQGTARLPTVISDSKSTCNRCMKSAA